MRQGRILSLIPIMGKLGSQGVQTISCCICHVGLRVAVMGGEESETPDGGGSGVQLLKQTNRYI